MCVNTLRRHKGAESLTLRAPKAARIMSNFHAMQTMHAYEVRP